MKKYLLAILIVLPLSAIGQEAKELPKTVTSLLIYKPSFLRCINCEVLSKDCPAIQAKYPGLVIREIILSEEAARFYGITMFPTIVVGKEVQGYNPKQLEEMIQEAK